LIFVVGSSLQTGSNKEDSSFGRNLFDQQISPKSKKKKKYSSKAKRRFLLALFTKGNQRMKSQKRRSFFSSNFLSDLIDIFTPQNNLFL
jgi:hypothetical protein